MCDKRAAAQAGQEGSVAKPRLLLIGTTGITGKSALEGLNASPVANAVQAVTLTRNPSSPAAQAMQQQGMQIVQGDLDDEVSLQTCVEGVDLVYCHALSKDAATADPAEVARAQRLAAALRATGRVQLVVYNSAGGRGKETGISQVEQKHKVEDIFSESGVPLCALQATLFMEELWKKYTRPGILQGQLTWSTPPEKPIQFLAARDIGLAAGYALSDPKSWAGKSLELAGDELTPLQLCEVFSQAQGGMPVKLNRPPQWPMWFLSRDLWRIMNFFSTKGYSADVTKCRQLFPGLHTMKSFLEATGWADTSRTYEQGIRFDYGKPGGK